MSGKTAVLSLMIFAVFAFHCIAGCPEGYFRDIQGPGNVKLGERHTYSVITEGVFRSVNWSITGGQFVKDYVQGNRYFCEVIWNEGNAQEFRVKVYGYDGCGKERVNRYYVSVDRGNAIQPRPGSFRRMDIPYAKTTADLLQRYYESQAKDGSFDEGLKNHLIRELTNRMNNDEAVDVLWGQGLKPAMLKSLDAIVNNCIAMKEREMIKRTLKREARAFLKFFYDKKALDENALEKWADILSRTRNPKVTQVLEIQMNLVDAASDLTVTHLKKAGIVPRLVTTGRN